MQKHEEEKIIERITTCLEEFGMPKFQDRFPAMAVLRLIKDSGFSKNWPESSPEPLNREKLFKVVITQIPLEDAFRINSLSIQDLEHKRIKRANILCDLILSVFSTPPSKPAVSVEILKDWLKFSEDVKPSCTAGEDWLNGLRERTNSAIFNSINGEIKERL